MEVCANPEENYQLAEKAVEVLMRKVPYEDNSWVIAEALWDACRSDVFPDDENIECEKILREMFEGSREEETGYCNEELQEAAKEVVQILMDNDFSKEDALPVAKEIWNIYRNEEFPTIKI